MGEEQRSAPLIESMRRRQRKSWHQGERIRAEDLLRAHPEMHGDLEGTLELIYNEVVLRQRLGEAPGLEEYVLRFPELAVRLELLFEVHSALEAGPMSADDGLSVRADPTVPRSSEARDLPPIPGYEIIRELGRGGAGVVYEVRQELLNRTAALKMLLAGSHAGPDQRARFRTEAEALAGLRHPNIVPIYEVGEHDGRPYLVMEYVNGGSLASRLAGAPWPIRETARVVESLAGAIHHAHLRGIVHRDLTPGNVLLALDGAASTEPGKDGSASAAPSLERFVPKITDFGLAKLNFGEVGARTQSGMILGTPSYMAPEQAEGRSRDIAPAADIYALGAILYEMFTGRPPFRAETPLETLLQVQSTEPVPPSRLRPKLPRDLATICLKCLEKEPARRYESAAALAEDLRRFQAGEPITARPAGTLERTWRWCRRNPRVASLAALLAAAVLGGLAGMTGLWLRAEGQRQAAAANLGEAHANLRLAIDAVDEYCTRVSEDKRLQEHDLRLLRRNLLQTAVDFQLRFVAKRAGDPAARGELARAYFRLGRLTAEIEARPRAVAFYEEARSLFEQLIGAQPEEAAYQQELAQCHGHLGLLYQDTGEPGKAEEALRSAQQLAGQLARRYPEVPAYRQQLAETWTRLSVLYQRNGRSAEAEAPIQEALALGEALIQAYPDVAGYQFDLARYHLQRGSLLRTRFIRRWREAETAYVTAVDLLRDLCRRDTAPVDYRATLVLGLRELGKIHVLAQRREEAESVFKEGIETQEHLAEQHANVTQYHAMLAHLYDDLGILYQVCSRLSEAEAPWNKALRIWERLVRQDPDALGYAAFLGRSQFHLAAVLRHQGDPAAALDWLLKSIRTLAEVRERNPQQSNARDFLTGTHQERAELLTELKRHGEALADWERVLELEKGPLRPWYRVQRALTLAHMGHHATATQEAWQVAEELSSRPHGSSRSFSDAARVHGLAVSAVQQDRTLPEAVRGRLAEEYGSRAVKLLYQAVQAGSRDLNHFQKTEFDSVRSRADFDALLREVEKPSGETARDPKIP